MFPSHDRKEKCAIFVEPPEGAEKFQGLTYLPREEFDKVEGFIESDEQDPVFTPEQVLAMCDKFKRYDQFKEFFNTSISEAKAHVKFFGEFAWQGHSMLSVNKNTQQQQQEFSFKCSNPACNHEKIAQKQYPVQENVEGRIVKNPGQLTEADKIIQKKLKDHVGSAVMDEPVIEDLPTGTYNVGGAKLVDNKVNPEKESGRV